MGNPGVSKEQAQEALDAYYASGSNKLAASRSLGLNDSTYGNRLRAAVRHGLCEHSDLKAPPHRVSKAVEESGLPANAWSIAWLKDEDQSILVYNPDKDANHVLDAIEATVEKVKRHAPKWPKLPKVKASTDDHCLIIKVADLHMGAYGLEEAKERLLHAVNDTLARAKPYNLTQIIYVGGNDRLHVDNALYTTTKGTPQQMDGSTWAQAFEAALEADVEAVAIAAQVAPVHYVHVASNHDEVMGYALSKVIEAWFRHAKNVTFDVTDSPRKYVSYGSNLFAFTHGDKIKEADLPIIIAHEAPDMWGQTAHRYCFMGHIHHSKQVKYQAVKEHPGIILEWLRSPKPNDKWHRDRGFMGDQGYKSFIHSKTRGQVASLSGGYD